MKGIFYRFLAVLARILGPWVVDLISRGIAAGYFSLLPSRTAVSIRFYAVLFPDRGRLFHLRCAWKQYQNFTSIYVDRILLRELDDIAHTSEGEQSLEAALESGSGGIILMSHMGNWDIAAHLMKRQWPRIRLMLYMGARAKESIDRMQKEDLRGTGVQIIAIGPDGGTPFDLIDAIGFVRSGGVVSLTGDQTWRDDQRTVFVRFLGHRVRVPEAPYVLALLSGVPLFLFFSFRTGPRRYHFVLSEPIRLMGASRADRPRIIQQAAQTYADRLEATLRRNPLEWYHFEPFLGPRWD